MSDRPKCSSLRPSCISETNRHNLNETSIFQCVYDVIIFVKFGRNCITVDIAEGSVLLQKSRKTTDRCLKLD